MSQTITGKCNCGRHEYTIPPPKEMNLCHCIDCRKWAGAMHSAHLFVKTVDIKTSSPKPKTWVTVAESGQEMERAWCDECGSGIWLKRSSDPSMTYLKAGLFEHEDIPNPTMENWQRNMKPWETPAKGTKYQSQVS
ncbi:hypothetical protein EG328_007147 [Venturia inaequalis]|uniref:CENP-V/GFA domain-containing protein n=1 Tax=Venturia inaequalis TaxID=5025 RepID=A0A8H3Z881_VENIN|nr:hypothetical protein EG328_007147 [Venturia inaequalis]KAE9984057.1 hypothetical protein EG327_005250 [Venturia inaequalis]RDI80941.1 hypothetical protein Vi05172_g9139 [Venturia inaequalis]